MKMYLQKVTSRKNCVKKFVFCWHLEGQWRKYQDPDQDQYPDPLVRGMDPRIRIRTKISWIRKTATLDKSLHALVVTAVLKAYMSLMLLCGREDEERAWAWGAEPGAEGSAEDGAGGDHPASHPAGRGPHTEAPGNTTDFITCVWHWQLQCCGSGMFILDPGYPDPVFGKNKRIVCF